MNLSSINTVWLKKFTMRISLSSLHFAMFARYQTINPLALATCRSCELLGYTNSLFQCAAFEASQPRSQALSIRPPANFRQSFASRVHENWNFFCYGERVPPRVWPSGPKPYGVSWVGDFKGVGENLCGKTCLQGNKRHQFFLAWICCSLNFSRLLLSLSLGRETSEGTGR